MPQGTASDSPRTIRETRDALVTVLNAHSGPQPRNYADQWAVDLWESGGVPTGEIAVTRWEGEREIAELSLTQAQAEAVIEALAGRGVVGGGEVERVVDGVVEAALCARLADALDRGNGSTWTVEPDTDGSLWCRERHQGEDLRSLSLSPSAAERLIAELLALPVLTSSSEVDRVLTAAQAAYFAESVVVEAVA